MYCLRCQAEGKETRCVPDPLRTHWAHCPIHEPEWVAWIEEHHRRAYTPELLHRGLPTGPTGVDAHY